MQERSRITVDLGAIRANVARLRAAAGSDVVAVVKADGYGHGAVPVGRAALGAGAVALAVATLGEARDLRAALPGARVIVLSPLAAGEERAAAGLEVVVSTPDGWQRIRDRADVAVHVKVDTGMGRWGLDAAGALAVGRALVDGSAAPRLAGLMTHLATSEDPDTRYAEEQIAAFRAVADGFPPCPRHVANSAAALRLPGARWDLARCGIALYGVSPDDGDPAADGLAPALRWTSYVALARTLAAGASTGYGRRFTAATTTRIAEVPVGYADGFPRPAQGGADVLVEGRRRRVVAVAMDQLAVRLEAGDDDLGSGAAVTLLGREGDERVGPEALGRAAGTIGYEVVCGLQARPARSLRCET